MFVAQVKAINKKLDHLLRHAPAAGDLELAEDTQDSQRSQDSQGSIADHLDNLGVEEDDEDDEDEAGARMDGPH